ncbi:aspartate aminotransferase family protein [Aerococcus urinaeequi]|uniref:aspartate aminotransferase family protein n=1 Tax=Aerococcus urinaeequi TaxID=51665 RepID=UPI003D6B6174
MEPYFSKAADAARKADSFYAPAGQIHYYDLVLKEASGSTLRDVDDKEYIDLLASASATNVGHSHPKVVNAMYEQMQKMIHYTPAYFYSDVAIELMEKLLEVTPGDFEKRVLFGNSGSDANDGIMKFARAYTGRQVIVSFNGAYHGSTYGSMTLSACSLNMRRKMQPLVPNVYYLPFPNMYQSYPGETETELSDRYLSYFGEALNTYLPVDEIAAVIIEPIQGDGGFIKPPKEYIQRLYRFCQENGIVFAVDEVNQGLGRSGEMWGIDHFDIAPDIMSIGKSLASGMPLSAIVGRKEIMESLDPPAHLFTTAGNPVCCAASLATLEVIEEEQLVEKSRAQGEYVRARFEEMKDCFDFIGDVRIYGLNGGIEIVESKITKKADGDAASKIITHCYRNGVLMITVAGNVLRFQPPLVITESELEKALAVLEDAFTQLANGNIELDTERKIGW